MHRRRPSARASVAFVALVAVVALAVVALPLALYAVRGGPAYDAEVAQRSLSAALQREHPARVATSCAGQRDGSHFFICEIAGEASAELPRKTSVGYDDDSATYLAERGGGPDGLNQLTFAPVG